MLNTQLVGESEILFAALIRRRDYSGSECASCEGTYQRVTFDTLRCDSCGDNIARYLTKSEFAAHVLAVSVEEIVDGDV
jgi:hypothetical protein